MNDHIDQGTLRPAVVKILAEHIGVEKEDITDEDFFFEDLHMNPTELTDFIGSLEVQGIDTGKVDMEEVETLGDLLDQISSGEI